MLLGTCNHKECYMGVAIYSNMYAQLVEWLLRKPRIWLTRIVLDYRKKPCKLIATHLQKDSLTYYWLAANDSDLL